MCNQPCSTCALSPGATANREPLNHLTAMLAVMGPFPFYCHETMDWQSSITAYLPPRLLKERGELKICEGWRREVAALARTGYYREDSSLTLTVARAAFLALRKFTTEGVSLAEQEIARRQLDAYVRELVEKKRKFIHGRDTVLAAQAEEKEEQTTMHGQKLWQFQCQKEGTLFYYQHSMKPHGHLVTRCPSCGSTRIKLTGRTYPGVDEASPSMVEMRREAQAEEEVQATNGN